MTRRTAPSCAAIVHYYWKHARIRAGIPGVHFHDLRHAGLTLSAQAGATLAEVMCRAGHNSAAAGLRYQHAADRRDAVIASRLSLLAAEREAERPPEEAPADVAGRPRSSGLVQPCPKIHPVMARDWHVNPTHAPGRASRHVPQWHRRRPSMCGDGWESNPPRTDTALHRF